MPDFGLHARHATRQGETPEGMRVGRRQAVIARPAPMLVT
jgi:hypothetical protein